jgi:hypothetical protein
MSWGAAAEQVRRLRRSGGVRRRRSIRLGFLPLLFLSDETARIVALAHVFRRGKDARFGGFEVRLERVPQSDRRDDFVGGHGMSFRSR